MKTIINAISTFQKNSSSISVALFRVGFRWHRKIMSIDKGYFATSMGRKHPFHYFSIKDIVYLYFKQDPKFAFITKETKEI